MATAINAPVTIKFVSVAGNSGNNYEWTVQTSINNWRADLAAAATPIWTGLTSRDYFSTRWRIMVSGNAYATPQGPYPYHQNARAEISNSCGRVELAKGRQSFYNLVAADGATAETLATPVI